MQMKAITIYQPWASLVAVGAKGFETRGWYTHYRGPIAIHAGMKSPLACALGCGVYGEWGDAVLKALNPGWTPRAYSIEDELEDLPTGCVVAAAELVGCHKIIGAHDGAVGIHIHENNLEDFREIRGNELLFGDWTPGRYAWQLANVQMLTRPIPMKGKQGLWNVELEVAR